MNQTFRIIIVGVLSCLSLGVKAADDDDTKEKLFNPVNYAVISLLPTRMSTPSIGTRQSIRSIFRVQVSP